MIFLLYTQIQYTKVNIFILTVKFHFQKSTNVSAAYQR